MQVNRKIRTGGKSQFLVHHSETKWQNKEWVGNNGLKPKTLQFQKSCFFLVHSYQPKITSGGPNH